MGVKTGLKKIALPLIALGLVSGSGAFGYHWEQGIHHQAMNKLEQKNSLVKQHNGNRPIIANVTKNIKNHHGTTTHHSVMVKVKQQQQKKPKEKVKKQRVNSKVLVKNATKLKIEGHTRRNEKQKSNQIQVTHSQSQLHSLTVKSKPVQPKLHQSIPQKLADCNMTETWEANGEKTIKKTFSAPNCVQAGNEAQKWVAQMRKNWEAEQVQQAQQQQNNTIPSSQASPPPSSVATSSSTTACPPFQSTFSSASDLYTWWHALPAGCYQGAYKMTIKGKSNYTVTIW